MGGTATPKTPIRRSPMQVGDTSRRLPREAKLRAPTCRRQPLPGFWMAALSCLPGPGGQGRSSHPRHAFGSCPLPHSLASPAWLITVPREPAWEFLIWGESHRDLPGSFLGSPSTERFCTQISSTGPGHPESHGHDQEFRLSDVTSVTEECCGRGRETGDQIPVEGQGWEMTSGLLRGLHK